MSRHKRAKWITLDAFGTLFDFRHVLREAAERVVDREGLEVDPEEFYTTWRENSRAQEWNSDPYKKLSDWFAESLQTTFEHFNHHGKVEKGVNINLSLIREVKPYPDVEAFLEKVHGPYKICVLSNVDNQELHKVLFNNKLQFDAIVTSEIVQAYKPSKKIFDAALSFIDTQIEDVVHVGDSPVQDIAGAKQVGMQAYWLNRHNKDFPANLPQPDKIVTNLNELAGQLMQNP